MKPDPTLGETAFDPTLWQGRIDKEDPDLSIRLHQVIQDAALETDYKNAPVLLGFSCDEGVRRNQGRVGAAEGPDAIRRALAPLTVRPDLSCFDAGNVTVVDQDLDAAQGQLAQAIATIFARSGKPIVLGGGHEIAWGSYQGLRLAFPQERVGVINFDAHLDLRNPDPMPSSGTPFRQIAEDAQAKGQAFHYCVIGLNPSANSEALMQYARQHNVVWIEDVDCQMHYWNNTVQRLNQFIDQVDVIYLTLCMDVFQAADAPGVSAPAALGIDKHYAIHVLRYLLSLAGDKVRLIDVAETNPTYDRDSITAKLAARWVWESFKVT